MAAVQPGAGEAARRVEVDEQPLAGVEHLDQQREIVPVGGDVLRRRDTPAGSAAIAARSVVPSVQHGQPGSVAAEQLGGGPDPVLGPVRGAGRQPPEAGDALPAPVELPGLALLGLGEEMGDELNAIRGQPLRQSARLVPDPSYYRTAPEFREPHRRGEILVAAMMNAFLEVWSRRLKTLGDGESRRLHRERVAEEGSRAADYLLTMTIRGLDYCPPVHLDFGDFLSAILTADAEIRPSDVLYGFREELRNSFLAYGIAPRPEGPWDSGGPPTCAAWAS